MKKSTLILFCIVAILACKKDKNQVQLNLSTRVDFKIGDKQYFQIKTEMKIDDTSIYNTDTLYLSEVNFEVWIEKDTLINNKNHIVIRTTYQNDTSYHKGYYLNNSEDFLYVAEKLSSTFAHTSAFYFERSTSKTRAIKKELLMKYPIGFILNRMENAISSETELTFLSSPKRIFSYPFSNNKGWTTEINSTQIRNRIVSAQKIITPADEFDCFEIKHQFLPGDFLYDESNTQSVYVSSNGSVFEKYHLKLPIMIHNTNRYGIAYFDQTISRIPKYN